MVNFKFRRIIVGLGIFACLFTGCGQEIVSTEEEAIQESVTETMTSEQASASEESDTSVTINIADVTAEQLKQVTMSIETIQQNSDWEAMESIPDDLKPEYIMLAYQEKTLLYGQDPNQERDYELIATLITYQNSSYVKEIISSAIIKNMIIPENALTFYYVMPDDIQEDLHELMGE